MKFEEIQLQPQVIQDINNMSSNNSMMNAEEMECLCKGIIYSQIQDNEVILELGTYQGRTTKVMRSCLESISRKSSIISVDNFVFGKNLIHSWIQFNNEYENNILVVSTTKVFLKSIKKLDATVLFIDAGHEYDEVYFDIENSINLVRSGGVIFIDDYCPWSYLGVYKAVNELLKTNKKFRVLKETNYYILFEKL